MASQLTVVTPPATEPLTLSEAKLHLRITDTDQDDHITDCIVASRDYLEKTQNRAYFLQTLRYRLDSFPDLPNATLKFFIPTYSVESYLARAISLMSGPILLPRPPLIAVTGITYIDQSGVLQTLSPSLYIVDKDAEPARIAPAQNQPWPVTLAQQASVNVTYTAGYTPATLPASIKHLLKLMVSELFEFREPFTDTMIREVATKSSLFWVDRVLEIP